MENASKALIIAGSILVAIMLVAMGVRIFNGARSASDETTLDATEISMFNQKFERFSGSQTGSSVKSLISFAISNASTNKDDPSKLPTIKFYELNAAGTALNTNPTITANSSNITQIGNIRKKIKSTHTYTVDLTYGTSGIITEIKICE